MNRCRLKITMVLVGLTLSAGPGWGQLSERTDRMKKAIATGDVAPLRTETEQTLRTQLSQLRQLRPDIVIDAACERALADLIERAGAMTDEQKATLSWLVEQDELARTLLLAVGENDDAGGVIAVLRALQMDDRTGTAKRAELTTALCVVWDTGGPGPEAAKANPAAAVERLTFLKKQKRRLKMDPIGMPWQIARHVIDVQASAAERRWALTEYRNHENIGRCYFDVPYDRKGLYSGEWAGIKGKPYTLANIRRHGGVCKDQAYFASQVAKSLGIPAVAATGQSGRGEGYHAWVGLMQKRGRRVWFDFDTGRYTDHQFWSGDIIDPQTGQTITDGDVALAAELMGGRPVNRLLARAMMRSVEVLPVEARLRVLGRAVALSPGDREAWMALADHCAGTKLRAAELQEIIDALKRFAVGRYDEFAFVVVARVLSGQPAETRVALWPRLAPLFKKRPDLYTKIRLAQGDAYRQLGRTSSAVDAYQDVITAYLKYGPMVLEAMDRLDAVLAERGEMDRLLRIYEKVWTNMKVPRRSGFVWTTPWYLVGEHYEKRLAESGRAADARRVRKQLDKLDTSSEEAVKKREEFAE